MLGVFWNPQDLLLIMGTEIFKIDASWAEKLKKTRVQFLINPTVSTHYLHTIHTLSKHHPRSIYTLEVPEGGAACVRQLEQPGAVQPRGARGGQAGQAPAHQGHRLRDALLLHGVQGHAVTRILCGVFLLYARMQYLVLYKPVSNVADDRGSHCPPV